MGALRIESMYDKLRDACLRLFRHIQCRTTMASMKKIIYIQIDGPPRQK